jgi:carbamoylphosphate synthase large subunit
MIVPGDIRRVCVDWACSISECELAALLTGDTVCIIAISVGADSSMHRVRAISAARMHEVGINVSVGNIDALFGAL